MAIIRAEMGNGCVSTGEQLSNRIRITEWLLGQGRARGINLKRNSKALRKVASKPRAQ
jgi:hypothetical protein